MDKREKLMVFGVFPVLVFLWAFSLRLYFFCGFVLGDDLEEYSVLNFIQTHGPVWSQQLQLRFGVWIIHFIFFELLGSGEVSFFLPTWLISSSFAVFGYLLLLRWNFTPLGAFSGGLLVASAPFEVLMGSIHSNDIILAWCIGFSLLIFFYWEKKPVLLYGAMAFLLWFGFYTKLWVVYFFPILGIFFLYEGFKNRRWTGFFVFSISTLILHGVTSTIWYLKVGEFFPFLSKHAASYPATQLADNLFELFLQYPEMIFIGSEMGNSLFGHLPYLWGGLVLLKIIFSKTRKFRDKFKWDRVDWVLLGVYGSFFFLLNFFPNSFKFDQYYSAPRIFRYMTPFSFAATLHVSKILLEFFKSLETSPKLIKPIGISVFFVLLILNLFFSSVSTGPGRTQRAALLSVVEDIKKEKPPQVIAEYWIGFFIRDIYLREDRKTIQVPYMMNLANFSEYENWLNENQDELPDGTMLVSGLASYVYYGAHYDGFRLNYFTDELDPRWELVNTYNNLDFLPVPEPARLWRWKGGKLRESSQTSSFPRVSVTPSEKPKGLFDQGMEAFDTGQCPETREFFRIFIEKYPRHPLIGDARYFTAICSFRAGEWGKTIDEFNLLISKNPESIWVGGANYHIGVSLAQMGEEAEARRYFNKVINEFSHDAPLVKMARGQLESLPQNSERGLLGSFLDWFKR